VEELRRDLRRYLAGAAVEAHPEPWWEGVGRFLERNRVILLLFVAYLISRVIVAFFARV
jgi:hypothetical protein